MSEQSVFVADDGRFVATKLARGPWDAGAQHGGAPAALLMRAFERLPGADGLSLARVTYEFMRPVPVGALSVEASIVRPGRRVQLLEASLRTDGDVEVVRARALRVQTAHYTAVGVDSGPLQPGPEHGRVNDVRAPHRPMFAPDAIEVRFVAGRFHEPGPAAAWFRMRAPLIGGEDATPLQRLAAAADFGNGISATLSWDHYLFINPDLTLYVDRTPIGEWIGLQSQTWIVDGGIGVSESVLYDQRGRVGRATQALLVTPR